MLAYLQLREGIISCPLAPLLNFGPWGLHQPFRITIWFLTIHANFLLLVRVESGVIMWLEMTWLID